MPRSSHAPSAHPPISYPRAYDASAISFSSANTSTTTRPRKSSLTLSNPMGWLSRNSTQSSLSSSIRTKRASGSKSPRSIELVSERVGPLGLGATVVRTPEEALQDSRVCLTRYNERKPSLVEMGHKPTTPPMYQNPSPISVTVSLPLNSPPMSLTSDEYESGADVDAQDSEDHIECEEDEFHPIDGETDLSPPVPFECPRSSLKATRRSSTEDLSQVPPLPNNIGPYSAPPEFRPILLSEVPSGPADFSKSMITLETCTQTYRTTMDTLTSRPSQLSAYLISLLPPRQRAYSNASSVYSTSSEDMSAYRHHLASQGLISRTTSNIHIFLDRPSAPYTHILNYLRSSTPPTGVSEILPRAAQLQSYSQSRLDALLELRDEAAYLRLDGLLKLCNDEVNQRQHISSPRLHTRIQSRTLRSSPDNGRFSAQSQPASVHALSLEQNSDAGSQPSNVSILSPKSHSNLSPGQIFEVEAKDTGRVRICSPPTPQSWSGDGRSSGASGASSTRRRSRNRVFNDPPAGWI
ncbi:hypothetical protein E1B28_004300 [Marasmius oreades]|uniref:Uncharacterized protein n=1 Tax=Marasmius oreades TaxID=181124 RepID=A0A9P7UY84_9AGAR|nr:uncharacterized protein E1B28_004300 [Marasmius oreades]KAG7096894.1 hypothetical protein E1B28_004300 [Marasmius oreades]